MLGEPITMLWTLDFVIIHIEYRFWKKGWQENDLRDVHISHFI